MHKRKKLVQSTGKKIMQFSMLVYSVLSLIFDDKRLTTVLMLGCLFTVVFVFAFSGVENNKFLHVGPSEHTVVMGFVVDTWYKWNVLCSFAFISTCLNDFIFLSINPWILNTIQDEKTHVLPYPKWVCLFITQTKSFYAHVMSIFGLALLLSQIDFFIIRTFVDILVGTFATIKYMEKKIIDEQYVPLIGEKTPPCPEKASDVTRLKNAENQE
jgi:hypothetical protein